MALSSGVFSATTDTVRQTQDRVSFIGSIRVSRSVGSQNDDADEVTARYHRGCELAMQRRIERVQVDRLPPRA